MVAIMTGALLSVGSYNGCCCTYLHKTGPSNETSVRVAHCWSVSSLNGVVTVFGGSLTEHKGTGLVRSRKE